MPAPTITALPTAPSRGMVPAVFVPTANAWAAALPGYNTELNTLGTWMNSTSANVLAWANQVDSDKDTVAADKAIVAADKAIVAADKATVNADKIIVQNLAAGLSFTSTSTSTVAISTGAKSFTVQAGESYQAGMPIVAVVAGDPTRYVSGITTSYSGTTLTIAVPAGGTGGSGSASSWDISIGGMVGPAGPGLPTGGTAGQILVKSSATDYDAAWTGAAPNFIADGAITINAPVALTAAGKLKAIADTGVAGGWSANSNRTGLGLANPPQLDSYVANYVNEIQVKSLGSNRFLFVYNYNSSCRACLATVSGTTITFGTEATITPTPPDGIETSAACYDAVNDRIVFAYTLYGYGYLRAASISGTVLTLGTAVAMGSMPGQWGTVDVVYDVGQNRFVSCYALSGYTARVQVWSLSGVTLTALNFVATGDTCNNVGGSLCKLTYDPTNSRVCLVHSYVSNSFRVLAISITGGNTPVLSSPANITGYSMAVAHHAALGQIVCASGEGAISAITSIRLFALGFSAGAYTVPSGQVILASGVQGYLITGALAYDAARGQLRLFYENSSGYGISLPLTNVGTAFTAGTGVTVHNTGNFVVGALAFSPTAYNAFHIWVDNTSLYCAYGGEALVITNAASQLGLASATVADGASVSLVAFGSKATGLSGLTIASDYYVTKDGTLSTTATDYGRVGKAISATELLITKIGA